MLVAYAAMLWEKQEPQMRHALKASLWNAVRAGDALQLLCTPRSRVKVLIIAQHIQDLCRLEMGAASGMGIAGSGNVPHDRMA